MASWAARAKFKAVTAELGRLLHWIDDRAERVAGRAGGVGRK
jgi:hypothetical protein